MAGLDVPLHVYRLPAGARYLVVTQGHCVYTAEELVGDLGGDAVHISIDHEGGHSVYVTLGEFAHPAPRQPLVCSCPGGTAKE